MEAIASWLRELLVFTVRKTDRESLEIVAIEGFCTDTISTAAELKDLHCKNKYM